MNRVMFSSKDAGDRIKARSCCDRKLFKCAALTGYGIDFGLRNRVIFQRTWHVHRPIGELKWLSENYPYMMSFQECQLLARNWCIRHFNGFQKRKIFDIEKNSIRHVYILDGNGFKLGALTNLKNDSLREVPTNSCFSTFGSET